MLTRQRLRISFFQEVLAFVHCTIMEMISVGREGAVGVLTLTFLVETDMVVAVGKEGRKEQRFEQ